MPTDFHIRPGRGGDAERIKIVINAAFQQVEAFFVDGDRVSSTEVLDSLNKGTFLLVEDGDDILGCVYVVPKSEAYLGLLSVSPGHQKRGLGSVLMQAAENFCREAGSRTINIKIVHLRKELPDFYHKRGYIETGTSEFPTDVETKEPVYFIDMSKRLQ